MIKKILAWWLEKAEFGKGEPENLVTSNFVTPRALAWIRSTVSLYCIVISLSIMIQYMDNGTFFIFFTYWTFLLLTSYFVFMTYLSWMYVRHGDQFLQNHAILSKPMGCFAVNVIFEVIAIASVGLDPVYWVAIYDPAVAGWTTYHVHGINAICVLTELFTSRVNYNLYHFPFFFAYQMTYLSFMVIYFAICGDWVYKALSMESSGAAIWYPAATIVFIIGHLGCLGVVKLRDRQSKLHSVTTVLPSP
eukprot:TRINITY_DN3465_c0_g2_i9.p1 TRINITY_DN3465_c0_g2~~TRINITY_DN3465_c0_g2_i9.p1  ORF type:complete len:248 (-),score=31.74 TRINITY_DN3465_c0_g2_i9:428-1171(-)